MLDDAVVTQALAQCEPRYDEPRLVLSFTHECVLEQLASATGRPLEELRPELEAWLVTQGGGIERDLATSDVGELGEIVHQQLAETPCLPHAEWQRLALKHLPDGGPS